MKRSDLKKGEWYISAAPSVKLDSTYASVNLIKVLDVEPKWMKAPPSYRAERPVLKFETPDGEVIEATDYTREFPENDNEAVRKRWAKDASRDVKALLKAYGSWQVVLVPISQIKMTLADWNIRKAENEERAKTAQEAVLQRKRERQEEQDRVVAQVRAALSDVDTNISAFVRIDTDEVTIRPDKFIELLMAVRGAQQELDDRQAR